MTRLRRLAVLMAAILALQPLLTGTVAAAGSLRPVMAQVVVGGSPLDMDDARLWLADGRLLAPVRPLGEALRLQVRWDPAARAATLTRDDLRVRVTVGRDLAWVERGGIGGPVRLDVAPVLVGGRMFAPLRFLAEQTWPGAQLHWSPAAGQVRIWRPAGLARPPLAEGPKVPPPGAPSAPGSAPDAPSGSTPGSAPGSAPSAPGTDKPQQPAPPKAPQASSLFVLSYYSEEEPYTAPFGAYASLAAFGPQMTGVAGFFSRIQVYAQGNATGYLEPMAPAPYEARRRMVEQARRHGLRAYLLIHNLLYGSTAISRRAVHQVLTDDAVRARLIAHLRQILDAEGYHGVNIDFEGIPVTDRDAYTRFVQEVAAALRPAGYEVTLSVAAKTDDNPANTWGYPYDYAALGKVADRVAIMTYDYHGYVTGPGPIAPLDWVRRVAEYARSQMPAEKVLLGLAAYGFDWTLDGGRPRYLGARQALDLARAVGATVRVDPALGAHFHYVDAQGRRHEVWFETGATMAARAALARTLGLGGVAIWRVGLEDPAFWLELATLQRLAEGR